MSFVDTALARSSGFIPEIWAQRALDVLAANSVLPRLVRRDTDFTTASVGEKITIPYVGTFRAKRKAPNTPAVVQQPAGGDKVTVTLDRAPYVDFVVEDVARAQANPTLMDALMRPAMLAIAEAVESDLFALWPGFTQKIGTFGTAISVERIREANRIMTDRRAPRPGRAVVISPPDEEALKNDPDLAVYFANSRPEAIAAGSIGDLDGARLFPTQLTPRAAVITFDATGGTFTVTMPALDADGSLVSATTDNITYSTGLTAASLQSTLAALTGVGTGNVGVTGPNGGPFVVVPQGTLAGSPLPIVATNVALTGGGASVTTTRGNINLAIEPEAMVLATRPFPAIDAAAGITAVNVTDPNSGLSIRVIYSYDVAARGHRIGFDMLYGVALLRDESGVVIRS